MSYMRNLVHTPFLKSEVISFNKLYSDALMRNQAFFQKLGLPNK